MELLRCENLTLGYEKKAVVRELSFIVNEGDYLFILGENGSGKTTLMRTILGLSKPLSGKITFGGGLRPGEVGYLPQQTDIQRDFPASVWEIVLSGCLGRRAFSPFYGGKEKSRAKDIMNHLGISEIERASYRELSGGQQQRVLLCRAFCAASRLIVLDEPTSGLDPSAAEKMYEIIKMLNDNKMTVMMISHDLDAAIKYASHILHIGETPLFFGKKEDYLDSQVGKNYLGRRACD